MEEAPWLIMLILFVASTVFCTFGFGDALLAMPFLSLMLGTQKATPLLALCGFTLAIALLGSSYKYIRYKEALGLILGSLIGVPIGVFILKNGDDRNIRIAIGCIISLIALYNLLHPSLYIIKKAWPAPIFGFAGGILGGAFNTSGPPVVIYGAMRQWPPLVFVGMMQAYFIPTDIFIIIGHAQSGLLNLEIVRLFLWCIPVLLPSIFIGYQLKKRIPVHKFRKGIFVIILLSGLMLIVRSIGMF